MTDQNSIDSVTEQYLEDLAAAVVPDYFLVEQFCNNGVASTDYIIPPKSSGDLAAASLDTGAPPLQQVKPSLGGAVFPRAQYNGILRLISNIVAYLNKGNNFTFDTKNAAGYASGAVLWDYATNKYVVSLKNSNVANFVTNPSLINNVDWGFVSVNPNEANAFAVSPTVPTLGPTDVSTKAINAAALRAGTSNSTIYNYPVSSKSTKLTFKTGDEFLLTVSNPNLATNYTLNFDGQFQAGATNYGLVTVDFDVVHDSSNVYSSASIVLNSITQNMSATSLTPAQLNSLFTFKAYLLDAPLVVNGITIASGQVVYTLVFNTSIPFAGTINTLSGVVSPTSSTAYTTFADPANNALLGKAGVITGGYDNIPVVQPVTLAGNNVFAGNNTFLLSPLVNGVLTRGQGIESAGSNIDGTWYKFNNGLILQFGIISPMPSGGGQTIGYPTLFSTVVLSCLTTAAGNVQSTSPVALAINISGVNGLRQLVVYNWSAQTSLQTSYFAIGV